MAGPTLAGKVTLDDSQAAAALRRFEAMGVAAATKLQASMGSAFNNIGKVAAIGTAAAAAAVAAGGVQVARGVGQIYESGRALQILSRQTGAGVQGLAILQTKFKEAGLDADGVGRAIFRLQKSIAGLEDDENKGGAGRIQKLGLSLAALQQMKPDQQLMAVGAAISKITDPAERSGAAMQIFGKAGAELGALFSGDFAKIPPNLAMNAQILARNAAIFEQVSIKLERVAAISQSFYLGAAGAMATTLGPILDQLERLNLVAIGAKFGASIAVGAKVLVGAFQLPDTAFRLIETQLAHAFASAGNVLVAGLDIGCKFFKDGMLESLQGIGSAIIATLMRSFSYPIAYLQAGIERALSHVTVKQDADTVASLKKERNQVAKQAEGRPFTRAETSHLKAVAAQISDIQNKYRSPQSLSERAAQIQKDGVRFGLYGGGQTADQWAFAAHEKMGEGFAGARRAVEGFQVKDVMGAARYGENAAVLQAKLGARGASLLGSSTGGTDPGLSKAAGERLMAQGRMALANSRVAIGADPAAYMFMGHSGMPGTARTNATDPYTARVDAARRMDMVAAHTIGIGGALDFDPSTRVGWTGASNFGSAFSKKDWANFNGTSGGVFKNSTSLTTGGLGGGAYGQTGNVWNQVSGRVNNGGHKSDNQHLAEIAKNTADLATGVRGSGGSSGGGSAPTATGK